MFRHQHRDAPVPLLSVACALGMALGCGTCDAEGNGSGEAPSTDPSAPNASPAKAAPPDLPAAGEGVSEECLTFCRRTLECAQQEGREVPDAARDCRRSCSPGGVHFTAPAEVLACGASPCGPAFQACSLRAMLGHMEASNVPVFPRVCIGLCAKTGWCARRLGRPIGDAERDCEAACAPGGAYASVDPGEHGCVDMPCGEPFDTCRRNRGPRPTPAP